MRSLRYQGGWVGAAIAAGASYLQGQKNRSAQNQANRDNAALQREFAQMGIQWRVKDAQKAGIHPLYALGANTTPATPSHVAPESNLGQVGHYAGQAVDSYVSQSKPVLPAGPVVFKDGSPYPHYTGKNGQAIPYSPAQAEAYHSFQRHDAQMALMDAQKQNQLAQAAEAQHNTKAPSQEMLKLFVPVQVDGIGVIKLPDPQMGESMEALRDPMVRGLWWEDMVRNNFPAAKKLYERVAGGKGAQVGTLLNAGDDMVAELVSALLTSFGKDDNSKPQLAPFDVR